MTTYKLQQKDSTFFTDPVFSADEWISILHAADNEQHRRQLDVLRMFLYQQGHKATCLAIGKEYSLKDTAIEALVVHFCKFAKKVSGKVFTIESDEKPEEVFWPIAMYGRYEKKLFEWELRPELVDALQYFLIEKLIEEYRGPILSEGLNNSRSEELYKWKIFSSAKGLDIEGILNLIGNPSNEMNILTWRTKSSIRKALQENHDELIKCFSFLVEEGDPFYDAYKKFVDYGKTFLGKIEAEHILKEKEACLFLACVNPVKNPLYKWTLFRDAGAYLGIDTKSSKPVELYISILNKIIAVERLDTELQEKLRSETAPYFWSDLLNAQDVLFQMQQFMQSTRPKNWLQQLYDSAIKSNDGTFTTWYPRYKESIELFRDMFAAGKTADEIPEETIDYFIRVRNNAICDTAQGCFTRDEYPKIRAIWPQVYSILKRNVEIGEISPADFKALEDLIRPALNTNKPVAYHRLWSALFPEKLTTCCKNDYFYSVYNRISELDESLPPSTGSWLEDNITLMDYFDAKVSFLEPLHRPQFAWYLSYGLDSEDKNKTMDKYIELLRTNKNIVLTGAPGTGKTYLAKKIAKAMGDENPGFVQFHPSYDYTDFVEGIRPNDEGKFERVNGIFKQFCADALMPEDNGSFDAAYEKLIKDLANLTSPLVVKSGVSDSTTFGIMVNSRGSLDLFTKSRETADSNEPEYKKNGSLTKERIASGENLYYWKGYYLGVKNLLIEKYGLVEGPKLKTRKDRVFIIDEINRGELSKIFGELFYALEPSYREEEERVKTQYQNLIEPGDPFEKGFFIPSNVYIIGTMNDIDRGVESMDFAIRRRFAWIEVKAEDRVEMLDEKIPELSEKAKNSMKNLNLAIKSKEIGLTSAYDIGPAYYLKLSDYEGDFEKLWEYHIKVILSEYLRGVRGIEEKLETLKKAFDLVDD